MPVRFFDFPKYGYKCKLLETIYTSNILLFLSDVITVTSFGSIIHSVSQLFLHYRFLYKQGFKITSGAFLLWNLLVFLKSNKLK